MRISKTNAALIRSGIVYAKASINLIYETLVHNPQDLGDKMSRIAHTGPKHPLAVRAMVRETKSIERRGYIYANGPRVNKHKPAQIADDFHD